MIMYDYDNFFGFSTCKLPPTAAYIYIGEFAQKRRAKIKIFEESARELFSRSNSANT